MSCIEEAEEKGLGAPFLTGVPSRPRRLLPHYSNWLTSSHQFG